MAAQSSSTPCGEAPVVQFDWLKAASTEQNDHPLLRPSASEETSEDMFDALDAFLETEFPELDSSMCSPTDSGCCWTAPDYLQLQPAAPTTSSSTSSMLNAAGTPSTAAPALSPQTIAAAKAIQSGATDASKAPTAFALASAAVPTYSTGALRHSLSGFTTSEPSIDRASSTGSALSTGTFAGAGTMPRWKVYHMQQRQELLSASTKPAAAQPAAAAKPQAVAITATAAAPTASVVGCTSPVSISSGGSFASAGFATATSSIVVPQIAVSEHLLLLNLQQQQQLQQQLAAAQQCSTIGVKRGWNDTFVGAAKKRSRVSAAGNIAAQNMYGLTTEPCQQLQQLQSLQFSLQQHIQQNYQQQVELYQQQQLTALHNQLHMRLQVQQHQFQVQQQPVRHKRQACAKLIVQ